MEMVKTVSVLGSSLEQLNNKLNCTDVIETFNVPGELLLFFFSLRWEIAHIQIICMRRKQCKSIED